MMNRTSPVRRHTRFPVQWPLVYGCDEFFGEGTVLDLTHLGWRIAGCMPVKPGMRLTLRIWPPDKPEQVRVEQANVLWVNGCEFAVDVPEMAPNDHLWVTQFLDRNLESAWPPLTLP